MKKYPPFLKFLTVVLTLSACTSSPAAKQPPSGLTEQQARGEYLVTILGCGGCHTEGALERLPYGAPLAGSKIGIAYSAAEESEHPSVVFPSNLTSHKEDGLGLWNPEDIGRAIRYGINHQGGEVISVMPWINYSVLTKEDTEAIVAFLSALPPVANKIPEKVYLGEPSRHPYLRIGVFGFTPKDYAPD